MHTDQICIKCRKPGEFYIDKSRASGFHPYCKTCLKASGAIRRSIPENREAARQRTARWTAENKDRAKAYASRPEIKEHKRDYMRKWRQANADTLRTYAKEYDKDRCATDINYKLMINLRKRLGVAIRESQKMGSAVFDLGCSISEFRTYLERLFKPGMMWDNWGRKGWHIDHIKALSQFDLTDREQFKQAVHFTNLQPLWASENLKKSKY